MQPDQNVKTFEIAGFIKYPTYQQQARIYFQNVNSMQKTPEIEKTGWKIAFEVHNFYRTNNMGWWFADDARCLSPLDCYSLEDAIQACRRMGGLIRSHL